MSDLFRVSLRQVVRQRGFGVILSIALGIMAFIALSVLGQEIRYKVGQDMVLMGGVNIIRVYMDDAQYPGQPRRDFSPRTVEALRKIPGVGMISENVRQGITFSLRASGERTLGVHFIGVDQYFATTYSLELVAGRMMSEEDVRGHRRICMLGREAATNLYGDPAQAVGKLLFLGKDVVEVVGVVTGVMLGEWNQGGFLPTTVMEDRNWGSGKITRLFVRAIGWEDVAPVVRQIPSVVRANQDAPYLVIATQDDQLDRIKTTFMWVEALLWLGIVASLMLGGFGIWYGTFAAVRARKEGDLGTMTPEALIAKLTEEIRTHLLDQRDAYAAQGMTEDAAQAASQESCQTEDTVQPQERDVSTEPQTASNDNAANAGAAQYFASTSDSAGSGQTETTQEDTVQAPASLPSTLQTAPQESTPQQEEDTARKETTLIQDVPASITTARVDEENSDGETGASSPQENTVECFAQLTLTPDQAGTLLDGMDASEVVRDPDTGAELQRIYYLDQQQFQDLTAQLEDVSWTDSGSGEWAKVVVVMQ